MTDAPILVRVLVVDDHSVVRAGIRRVLEATPGIEVVGDAPDGAVGARLAAQLKPDVVLMDLSMPVLDGIGATRAIVAEDPRIAVLVLTSFAAHHDVLRALDAGAAGYILKDSEPDVLVAAIRAAATGDAPLDPRAGRALLHERRGLRVGSSATLTGREQEVLAAVARGLANKAIARELGISDKTVKAHLTRIYGAIGVTDRTQAALWFQQQQSPGFREE